MVCLIVFLEKIAPEVPFEIPPDCMNMTRIVLGISILEKKGRTLDTIVVRLSFFQSAGPGKENVLHPRFFDCSKIVFCDFGAEAVHIDMD